MRRLYDSTKTDSTPKLQPSTPTPSAPMDLRPSKVIGMAWNLRSACRNRWSASPEWAGCCWNRQQGRTPIPYGSARPGWTATTRPLGKGGTVQTPSRRRALPAPAAAATISHWCPHQTCAWTTPFTRPSHPDLVTPVNLTADQHAEDCGLYLAVTPDPRCSRIFGWPMAPRMSAALTGQALAMAISCRQPQGPGISQYAPPAFPKRCHEAAVVQSMGSVAHRFPRRGFQHRVADPTPPLLAQVASWKLS